MSYNPGDKVFAKVKGHPHWPCRINLLPPDVAVPKGKYPIFFYGTHEVYFLGPKDLFPYEKFKSKYGVCRNKPAFQAGLIEIEENPDVLFLGKDPDAETFLARFYKFTVTGGDSQSELPSGKRPSDSPVSEPPAKRPHVEPPVVPPSPEKTPIVKAKKSIKKQSTPTQPKIKTPKPKSVPKDLPSVKDHTSVELKQSAPKRVSSLRLRIRKGADGLPLAQSADSLPSSPVTSEPAFRDEPLEAPVVSKPSGNESLRITIKQVPVSSAPTGGETPSSPRPMFSVTSNTPTPTVQSNFMGLGSESATQKKSTAVVTPLRRNTTPLEVPKENKISPAKKSAPKSPSIVADSKNHLSSKHDDRKRHRSKRPDKVVSPTVALVETVGSETGSGSTSTPQTPNDYLRGGAVVSETSLPASSKSPITTTAKLSSPKSSHPSSFSSVDNLLDSSRKEQEQQLKDLDTEARLLLIDRSIKSSLIRDHEDIRTCVDRLEMLDRMPLALPMLAKCWTVVETIGKCRRYKRSMEVKIAAQKIFNKFLQLYATADKHELDLAVAELSRHQHRYMKQQVPRRSTSSDEKPDVQPYTGPKSLAELFQVSTNFQSDRKRQCQFDSHYSTSSTTPSGGEQTQFEIAHHRSRASSKTSSVDELQLPEELRRLTSKSEATPIQPDEEYEVLDEYDASNDSKPTELVYPNTGDSANTLTRPPTVTAVSMVETEIIPYSMIPAHLIPPSYPLELPSPGHDACNISSTRQSEPSTISLSQSHTHKSNQLLLSREHYRSHTDGSRHSRGSMHDDRHPRPHHASRTSPKRARSPHALPHPLEHYQRCLTHALTSEERQRVHSSHPEHSFRKSRIPSSEDLDTRIARIIGTSPSVAPRVSSVSIPKRPSIHSRAPVPPPPPPPPPPPSSHRILFTHRPRNELYPHTATPSDTTSLPSLDSPHSQRHPPDSRSSVQSQPNPGYSPFDPPRRQASAKPSDAAAVDGAQTLHTSANHEPDRDLYSLLGV